MDLSSFEQSLGQPVPPAGLTPALAGLWHQGRGEWDLAHRAVQAHEGRADCDWVHAHLHRVEGDLGNAGYWYRQARRPVGQGDLHEEWRRIVEALLGQG